MKHFVDLGGGCIVNIKMITYILKGGDDDEPDLYQVNFRGSDMALLLDDDDFVRLSNYMANLLKEKSNG